MATAEDTGYKVEKLTADNYHSWKIYMKSFFIAKGLSETVKCTETLNKNANEGEQRKV